jgi:hypothetical protein
LESNTVLKPFKSSVRYAVFNKKNNINIEREVQMSRSSRGLYLSPPQNITWWIALILAVLGVIGYFVKSIPVLSQFSFWFVLVSAVLLLIATRVRSL